LSTASIGTSVAALQHATAALLSRDDVDSVHSRVSRLELTHDDRDEQPTAWHVTFDKHHPTTVNAAILCPGAQPRRASAAFLARLREAGIEIVDHDDLVCPDYFEKHPHRLQGMRLAVVGPSHSGLLGARNALLFGGALSVDLLGLEKGVRYAEFRGEGTENSWIKYDGTGLKGKVKEWTLQEFGKATTALAPLRYHRTDGDQEEQTLATILSLGVDAVAWTTGFSALEECSCVEVISENGTPINLLGGHDGRTGTFRGAPASLVGGGLAFPEIWTDPEGFEEARVGFVKHYSRHLDRMISRMEEAAQSTPKSCAPYLVDFCDING
jgi:hypothetical protein